MLSLLRFSNQIVLKLSSQYSLNSDLRDHNIILILVLFSLHKFGKSMVKKVLRSSLYSLFNSSIPSKNTTIHLLGNALWANFISLLICSFILSNVLLLLIESFEL